MRSLSVTIGFAGVRIVLAVLGLALSVQAAIAAGSASYTLYTDAPNQTSQNTGQSASYTLSEAGMHWNQQPLLSAGYQVVPQSNAAAVSTSGTAGGTATQAEESAGARPASNRRPRPPAQSPSGTITAPVTTQPGTTPVVSGTGFAPAIDVPPMFGAAADTAPVTHPRDGARQLIHFFDAIDAGCPAITDLHASAPDGSDGSLWVLLIAALLLGVPSVLAVRSRATRRTKRGARTSKTRRARVAGLLVVILTIAGALGTHVDPVRAAQTVPSDHVYNGRLLDASGNAVTSAQSMRFSYWKSSDAVSGDTTGTGAINTGAANYAGWQEVHTVTPNASGYFSVELGSITTLPDFSAVSPSTLVSLYLQVEIKPSGSANTAYENQDADPNSATIDRSSVLSVPFAKNAELLDQREVGTASGSIAILGPGGLFGTGTVAGGTNKGVFTLDADSTEASQISLTFGGTLQKKLTYDISAGTFTFNTNVTVQGNLTVSGLVNGIDLSQLQSSTGALKAFSGGGLNLNVSQGSYRLNGSVVTYAGGSVALSASKTNYVFFGTGGLTKQTTGFPTASSFIPVAQVVTYTGSIASVTDKRTLSSDDRERLVVDTFNPSYEKASYQGDGGDNVGQLLVAHDNINLNNFYAWTSTRSTLQDYDILLKIPLPPGFVRWKDDSTHKPISISYRSTSASSANNKLDIQVYDTNGVPVTLVGSSSDLANTSWTTTELQFSGSPTWTAGQQILVRLKVSAKDNFQMQLGALKLQTVDLQ